MSKKQGAYGAASANDPSFRRTWDRDEYAAKAAAREAKIKEEGKAAYEAKLAGKKYHRRASTPEDVRETEFRTQRFNVADQVGKQTLVAAGSTLGKRGKGAGFYCAACDLTFKDNLQYVEHENSKQHQMNTGQSGEVRRATLEEVRERLAWLKRKADEEKNDQVVDLSARLESAREREERERAEKRRKRNERRGKGGGAVKQTELDSGVGIAA